MKIEQARAMGSTRFISDKKCEWCGSFERRTEDNRCAPCDVYHRRVVNPLNVDGIDGRKSGKALNKKAQRSSEVWCDEMSKERSRVIKAGIGRAKNEKTSSND